MDLSPTVLFESLRSDLFVGLNQSDRELIESDSCLSRLCEPSLYARKALLQSFLKKFQEGSRREVKDADRRAFDLFTEWNTRCKEWCPPQPQSDEERTAVGIFRSTFLQCFETQHGELIDFSDRSPVNYRVGPGAAVDANLTDLYSKLYAGPLSVTRKDLYWEYFSQCLPFELESEAEVIRSQNFETPVVKGSLLGFAPKNRDVSRTRCTEPSLNMLYQLGAGAVLEEVILERFNVKLDDQPELNRELSRRGSLDGSVGTTDLSSASDATSLGLWRWAMQYDEIHNFFLWIRSPATKSPYSDEWIDLHLLSSMGNGFTFPLMTLIFLCVVKAAYETLGIPLRLNKRVGSDNQRVTPGNFGVFGDDIIVVTEAFDLVNRLLVLLGYSVNAEKSFGDGPFRESCGTDWFLGNNVRGVYCKHLKRPQHRYALINLLNSWSSEWDIPLPATVGLLKRSVYYIPIPPWESAEAGIMVPFRFLRSIVNDEYGGIKYHAFRPKTVTWSPESGLTALHSVSPGGGTTHENGVVKPRARAYVNSFGVILAAVKGYLRGGLITCRDDNVKYRKTVLTTPGWGFSGQSTVGFTRSGWARFDGTLAGTNLGLTAPD